MSLGYCIYLPLIAFSIVGLSFWYPFFPPPFMFETAMTSLLKKVSIKKQSQCFSGLCSGYPDTGRLCFLDRLQSSKKSERIRQKEIKINRQNIYNFTQSTALSDGYQVHGSL